MHKKVIVACFKKGNKQEIRDFGATTRELLDMAEWLNDGGCEMVAMESTSSYWKGFCFEARHKRLLIDDEYYFPDLVFYNRILHCSVIIELKNEEFSHENLGQLNAYVGYYKENEMYPGDNPPVGILLCTKKGKKW